MTELEDTEPAPRHPRPEGSSASRMESEGEQRINEQLLQKLLEDIDRLAGLDDQGFFDLEPGSALYLDDVAIYPLKTSALARITILAAIDELITIRDLVRTGVIPMMGMGPLLRAALETACIAIYLLNPEDRRNRVLRSLREEYFEIKDHESVVADLQPEATVNRSGKEDQLRRALAGLAEGPSWHEITHNKQTITAKITAAEPTIEQLQQRGRGEHTIRGYWQVFSGLTHGRQYAAMEVLDREELAYDEETGTVTARLTFSLRALVGTLRVVLDAVDTALRLYGQLARQFTRAPADSELESVLREEGRL